MKQQAKQTPSPGLLREACLAVARHYHGAKGEWAYALFDALNAAFFAGELPWPHISWALTPYGSCLGYSYRAGPPVIVLHPSLLGGSEKNNPWKVPSAWLSWRFAADVLFHEVIHLSVIYRLGGWSGPGTTSHNNEAWVADRHELCAACTDRRPSNSPRQEAYPGPADHRR